MIIGPYSVFDDDYCWGVGDGGCTWDECPRCHPTELRRALIQGARSVYVAAALTTRFWPAILGRNLRDAAGLARMFTLGCMVNGDEGPIPWVPNVNGFPVRGA